VHLLKLLITDGTVRILCIGLEAINSFEAAESCLHAKREHALTGNPRNLVIDLQKLLDQVRPAMLTHQDLILRYGEIRHDQCQHCLLYRREIL